MKIVIWVPSFSRARPCFLLFLGSLLSLSLSLVARNTVRTGHFLVGRSFSCSPTGRPSLRWVGPKTASLQLAPVRAAPVRAAAGGCASAELGGAYFSSSFRRMLVVPLFRLLEISFS